MKDNLKVRCERWRICKDDSCYEKEEHEVRRDKHYSCKRKAKCITTGKVCGCVEIAVLNKSGVLFEE